MNTNVPTDIFNFIGQCDRYLPTAMCKYLCGGGKRLWIFRDVNYCANRGVTLFCDTQRVSEYSDTSANEWPC